MKKTHYQFVPITDDIIKGLEGSLEQLTKLRVEVEKNKHQYYEAVLFQIEMKIRKVVDSIKSQQFKSIGEEKKCVDCGKQDKSVRDRGLFNGNQCDKCKNNQDIEDEECR